MAEYETPPPTPASGPMPPPYPTYPPPRPRRLMRSTHERMWAGVAGGMAEYFEIDPSLVRLLWIAATVVTGGLAVPVYILAWIILPRDDRTPIGPNAWRDWSEEFHSETQRWATEARRMADDVREASHTWRAPDPGATPPPPSAGAAPQSTGAPTEEPWWQSERYVERHRMHNHRPRSAGIVLVALGILLLAANAGAFNWVNWHMVWPLIFIGIGIMLLGRQAGWWNR